MVACGNDFICMTAPLLAELHPLFKGIEKGVYARRLILVAMQQNLDP